MQYGVRNKCQDTVRLRRVRYVSVLLSKENIHHPSIKGGTMTAVACLGMCVLTYKAYRRALAQKECLFKYLNLNRKLVYEFLLGKFMSCHHSLGYELSSFYGYSVFVCCQIKIQMGSAHLFSCAL